MKLTLKTPKPRNPLVAPSLQRKAGVHRTGGGACRQQAQAARNPARKRPGHPLERPSCCEIFPTSMPCPRTAGHGTSWPRRCVPAAAPWTAWPCAWPMSRCAHGPSRCSSSMPKPAEVRARAEPVLEFYAEAGAPEGALYVDGRLVGLVAGVNRL